MRRHVLTATYADDTAFLATSALRREASDMAQDMFNEFEAWASRWNIDVYSAKFELNSYRLSLYGTPIKHSDTVKYLGLTLDRRLSCRQHIVATYASTRQKERKLTAKTLLFKVILIPSLH